MVLLESYLLFFYEQTLPQRKVYSKQNDKHYQPIVNFKGKGKLIERFYNKVKDIPKAALYSEWNETKKDWDVFTYEQEWKIVSSFAKSLLSLKESDHEVVAIFSDNRKEYPEAYLGAHAAAFVPTGLYHTCSPKQIEFILNRSEAKYMVVETEEDISKVLSIAGNVPTLRHIIVMNDVDLNKFSSSVKLHYFQDFLKLGAEISQDTILQSIKNLDWDDTATYIFTSGTTGNPKAVILTHANCAWISTSTVETAIKEGPPNLSGQHTMSYLPLSHIAEQICTIFNPCTYPSRVYFINDPKKIISLLPVIRPTQFFGVPRVWEKIATGVQSKLADASVVKKWLFAWASSICQHSNEIKARGGTLNFFQNLKYKIATGLVMNKLKTKLGLDRCTVFISGAAPLSASLAKFFDGLDFQIQEVYGSSETSGLVTISRYGFIKNGFVGLPIPGTEIKIADNDEICIRGPGQFKGYYKEPELTKNAHTSDGFFKTGDLGKFDSDGFLKIIGRCSDTIITSGGKNVSPATIVNGWKPLSPLIEDVVVCGDGKHYLTALIILSEDECKKRYPSMTMKQVSKDPEVIKQIDETRLKNNENLNRVEQIKKFVIADRSLSMEKGEVTNTLKTKNKVVLEHFASLIETMYAE